jgi:hypothetical protein
VERRADAERRIDLSQSSVQLGDAGRKLGRLRGIERVEVQRDRPGERAEEPAHLRPSRHLLDADADEHALCGSGRADERSERRPGRRSHRPGHDKPGRSERPAVGVERDELTAVSSARRRQAAGPQLEEPGRVVHRREPNDVRPEPGRPEPDRTQGLPHVESPKPVLRFAIESRPPRRADSDPAHAEHPLVSRKAADLVGDSAVLDNDLADEKRCESGAGNSDAEAREQDGARPGCDPPCGDREGSNDPPRHHESLGLEVLPD